PHLCGAGHGRGVGGDGGRGGSCRRSPWPADEQPPVVPVRDRGQRPDCRARARVEPQRCQGSAALARLELRRTDRVKFFTCRIAIFASESGISRTPGKNTGFLHIFILPADGDPVKIGKRRCFGNPETALSLSLLSMVFHWCKRLRGD